jgi:hypothetical protein
VTRFLGTFRDNGAIQLQSAWISAHPAPVLRPPRSTESAVEVASHENIVVLEQLERRSDSDLSPRTNDRRSYHDLFVILTQVLKIQGVGIDVQLAVGNRPLLRTLE